jgi:haloalkane dehalogenase
MIVRAGLRLAYRDEGQGEPIVMVHGNPTWSFYFRNLAAGLRDNYRVIVPDHIGCGLSDKPGDDRYEYTLESRARDLERLLDHLGITRDVTLVLHDWGGMIGMTWASWHPERVRRLVVLNTAAFLMPAGNRMPWQLRLVRDTFLGPLLVRGLNLFSLGAVRSCVVNPLPPEVRAGYLAPYDSWANRIGVLRFVQDIPIRPGDRAYGLVRSVMDGLHRFRDLPLLICWGEKDFVFDEHFLAEWQRRFPGAQVHRFPQAGHFVLEDAGAEVLALVREFLSRHPIRP